MIHADLFHFTWESSKNIIRSHKLEPSEWVTLFCILAWERENIISILEDHLLESISGMEWTDESINTDFTYISENFNHFVQNIDENDLHGIGIVFAILVENHLMFSHIWKTWILLVEENGNITPLNNNDPEKNLFEAISNWEVLSWSHIYLSSSSIEERLSDDLLRELSELNTVEWKNIVNDLFKKELQESLHIVHIHNERIIQKKEIRGKKQIDILRNSGKKMAETLKIWSFGSIISNIIDHIISSKKKEAKVFFLGSGVILLFWLLYLLFAAISGVVSSPERDTKNELIHARELIEQSQQLTNDSTSFNKNIEQAESILFWLREKRVYMSDTQELLARIEAMKKEINDIQSIDVSKLKNIIKASEVNIDPVWLFEYNKKINLIWKEGAILEYARGEWIPTVKKYPTWEKAKNFDFGEDGTYFILTEGGKVLSKRGTEITYVSNNGKTDWVSSPSIKTFNGNIYLIENQNTLNRYKPWINGFSTATPILQSQWSTILDIWIDGGIYAILSDGKITRYIGWTTWWQKSLTVNKVPWEYTLWNNEKTQIYTRGNLSYVYVLSGKNVWIFSPDSKRFQDVTAWNYVAQLELQSSEEIRNISIPRDGIMYIVTSGGAYELWFEIADWKIILR